MRFPHRLSADRGEGREGKPQPSAQLRCTDPGSSGSSARPDPDPPEATTQDLIGRRGDPAPSSPAKLRRSQEGEQERLGAPSPLPPHCRLLVPRKPLASGGEGRGSSHRMHSDPRESLSLGARSRRPPPQPGLTCAVEPGGDGVEEGVLGCQ